MKHVIFAFLALFIITATKAQGINFVKEETSFNDVLAIAKAENKLVFVDCYTVWCGPCKLLAKEVFPLKEVGDVYNKDFVSIKMDMEKGEGIDLAKKWSIVAFPTLLYFDANGNEINRTSGATAKSMIDLADIAVNPSRQFANMQKRYDDGERDMGFMLKYLDLLGNKNRNKMKNVLDTYRQTLKLEDYLTKDGYRFATMMYPEYNTEITQYLIKNRDVIVENGITDKSNIDMFIQHATYMYLEKQARNSSIKELDKEIEKVAKTLKAGCKDGGLSDQMTTMKDYFYGNYYLANKDADKWFRYTMKYLNAQPDEQAVPRKMRMAWSVGFDMNNQFIGQTKLYNQCVDMVLETTKLPFAKKWQMDGYYELAYLHYRLGNKDLAISAFEKYKAANASNPSSKKLDERLIKFIEEMR